LPDIDIRIIKKINKLKKRKKLIYYLFFPFFWLLRVIFKHRTITHSLWIPFLLLIVDIYQLINNQILVSLIRVIYLALILHILEDSLTKTGVDLFYPLKVKLKVPIFSTSNEKDSIIIKIISLFLFLIFIFLVIGNSN
jgi:inner membrane protein